MTAAAIISSELEGGLFDQYNADLKSGTQGYSRDLKFHMLTLPNTTDASDTSTVDLFQECGMKRLLGIKGWVHTTDNSVITSENPTTTVSNGRLTLTVPVGSDDDLRVYMLIGV